MISYNIPLGNIFILVSEAIQCYTCQGKGNLCSNLDSLGILKECKADEHCYEIIRETQVLKQIETLYGFYPARATSYIKAWRGCTKVKHQDFKCKESYSQDGIWPSTKTCNMQCMYSSSASNNQNKRCNMYFGSGFEPRSNPLIVNNKFESEARTSKKIHRFRRTRNFKKIK